MAWAPPTIEPAATKQAWYLRYWWLILIVGIIAIVAIPGIRAGADADKQRYAAHAACAEFSRDRLKAPGTADFPEYDDRGVAITGADNDWTVRSYVDSDNSFGASIRTTFTCQVRDMGSTWRLIDWAER